jgi:hypothetical protein
MVKMKIGTTAGTQTPAAKIFPERWKPEMPLQTTNRANISSLNVNSFVTL